MPQNISSTDILVYITCKRKDGRAEFFIWPKREVYCSRKAVIGSSLAARRAGSHDATAEIAKKTTVMPATLPAAQARALHVINTAPRPTSTATRTAPRCISTGEAARGATGGAAAVQSVRMPGC